MMSLFPRATSQVAALVRIFGDCREGGIPRSLLRFHAMMPRSLLRGISLDEEEIMKSFIRSERHDEAREIVERMIKKGKMSLEEIAEYVPSLSLEELKELETEVMQPA